MVRARDEAVVDVRPIEVRAPDRVVDLIGPVDVLPIDSHAFGAAQAGDEVVVDIRAIEVRAPDRVVAGVTPIDERISLRRQTPARNHREHRCQRQHPRPMRGTPSTGRGAVSPSSGGRAVPAMDSSPQRLPPLCDLTCSTVAGGRFVLPDLRFPRRVYATGVSSAPLLRVHGGR
jgi:hypothetical protein